ncbi:MAG TPA: hypothetical protein VNA21_08920, partial [Steroidobacteraceae bacterium]|nr:hypothetical protein [Steroidobacteraceae bacterium]
FASSFANPTRHSVRVGSASSTRIPFALSLSKRAYLLLNCGFLNEPRIRYLQPGDAALERLPSCREIPADEPLALGRFIASHGELSIERHELLVDERFLAKELWTEFRRVLVVLERAAAFHGN